MECKLVVFEVTQHEHTMSNEYYNSVRRRQSGDRCVNSLFSPKTAFVDGVDVSDGRSTVRPTLS